MRSQSMNRTLRKYRRPRVSSSVTTVIVDCGSGNLHSVEKSFQRAAADSAAGEIRVSADPDEVARASRLVLPGVGAFADCRKGINCRPGLFEALNEAAMQRCVPFLGICVGMQLLADFGREHTETCGLGWIPGVVDRVNPDNGELKVPHMGWNELELDAEHFLFGGLPSGVHAYFVHSYQFYPSELRHRIARVDYGGDITAAVALKNLVGVQFHPEKSQRTGLKIIQNFLQWNP